MSRRPAGPGRPGRPGAPRRPARTARPDVPYRRRPFEGWPGEADLVALREVVPSATAPLRLLADPQRRVTLATVLPMSWAAMVRRDGAVVLALQTAQRSGDLVVDLGQALTAALAHETSAGITGLPLPGAGTPDLRDLVAAEPLAVTVHDGFDWWLADPGAGAADGDDPLADTEVADALERANAAVVPTARLTGVEAAYWCRIGERAHLRWARSEDEDALLDALARLHVRRALALGPEAPYVGAFRAQGVVVPVWDLPAGDPAEAAEEPAAALHARLAEALAETAPLTADERRARAGVVSRQVTLR